MTAKDQPVDELKRYRAFFNDITGCNEDWAAERLIAFCQAECNKARIDELRHVDLQDENEYIVNGYFGDVPLGQYQSITIRQRIQELQQLLKGEK